LGLPFPGTTVQPRHRPSPLYRIHTLLFLSSGHACSPRVRTSGLSFRSCPLWSLEPPRHTRPTPTRPGLLVAPPASPHHPAQGSQEANILISKSNVHCPTRPSRPAQPADSDLPSKEHQETTSQPLPSSEKKWNLWNLSSTSPRLAPFSATGRHAARASTASLTCRGITGYTPMSAHMRATPPAAERASSSEAPSQCISEHTRARSRTNVNTWAAESVSPTHPRSQGIVASTRESARTNALTTAA
jgi:hypothetical protein